MNKYYLKAFSFVALFAMCVALLPANAAGRDSTYDGSAPGPGDGEIDAADVTAGYAEATVAWTTSHAYASDTTITLTVTWSSTTAATNASTTNLAACATPETFTGNGYYSSGGFTASQAVINMNAVPAATAGVACAAVPVELAGGTLTSGNFSLAFITSEPTTTTADFGVIEWYVDSGNDVTVTGNVQPTLEFAITEPLDVNTELANHLCDLGTITTAAVSDCSYRLRISTNASLGFTVKVQTDGGLTNNGYATITDVVNDQTVTAGNNEYGIAITEASVGGYNSTTEAYSEPIQKQGIFASDDSPLTEFAQTLFVSFYDGFAGTDSASTSLITHKAAVDSTVPVGIYDQLVTYTITADF